MNIVIIPARGGSKRIPQKNIKPFLGKPIIAYSIEAALAVPDVNKVIVSTDCKNIAQIAKQYGAEVPFIRDSSLADDYSSIGDVFNDAIKRLEVDGDKIDYACCLFATAPLVDHQDIQAGLKQLQQNTNVDQVLSVTTFAFPIQRAQRKNQDGKLEYINSDDAQKRSQDLEEMYHDAGQFFWTNLTNTASSGVAPYPVPRFRVQDIDTEEDWKMAEALYQVINPNK